jgi:hypothetical protein
MIDPITSISAASSTISVAKGVLGLIDYLKEKTNSAIISALFSWNCDRIEGSVKIEVEQLPIDNKDNAWFYRVKEVEDYTFIRFPVIESGVYEQVGKLAGEENPDARLFRWIAFAPPSFTYGKHVASNVKVNFVIIGYQPKALVEHITSR